MPYCRKCGEEANSDIRFCPRCGAEVAANIFSQPTRVVVPQRNLPESDVLSLMSVGVILILLAIIYIQYPIDPNILGNYFKSMDDQKTFI